MNDIFTGFILIAIGASVYLWKKDKKKEFAISIALLVASFIGFGVTMDDSEEVEAEEPEQEEAAEVEEEEEEVEEVEPVEVEEEPAQRSADDVVAKLDELGKEAYDSSYRESFISWDMENVSYHEDGSYDPDNSTLDTIGVDLLISNSEIRSFLIETTDFLSKVQDMDFNWIKIGADGVFTDQYGEESEKSATYIGLYKEEIDKINFDNFDWRNLPSIAEEFWMHDSMGTKGM